MCIHKTLRENRKYLPNKKNGGIVPPFPIHKGKEDKRVRAVPTGCGQCFECKKQKGREWQVRLLEDIKHYKNALFVTLTFSDKSIKEISRRYPQLKGYTLDNQIATKGVEMFLNKWKRKYKHKPRHWLVTELGHEGTENIHLHGIIYTDKTSEEITERWGHGFTWIGDEKEKGYVNGKTVNYIVKYITKQDEDHKYFKPKILATKGIGRDYIKTFNASRNKYKPNGETKETYTTETGHEIALPIYYRNKLYSNEEKEKLWLEKLDKGIMYIDGKEITVNEKDNTKILKALEQARLKNVRLGYGGNEIDYDQKEYEEKRRQLLMNERIKRTETKPKEYTTPTRESRKDILNEWLNTEWDELDGNIPF